VIFQALFATDKNDGLAGLGFLVAGFCFFIAMVLKPVEFKVILLLPLRKIYVEVVLESFYFVMPNAW
jgi:hypothetical protein